LLGTQKIKDIEKMKHINTNSESSNLRAWRFREVPVSDGEIIDVPKSAKCLNLRPLPKSKGTCLQWIEPAEDEGDC